MEKHNDELIIKKSWWRKYRKWLLGIFTIICLSVYFLISSIEGNPTDIVKAYSDESLLENALNKTKKNQRVLDVLGKLEPIDKLAIIEGNAVYSNNDNYVELSVRIKGNKGQGKMDVSAEKKEKEWQYKKINIRVKNTKETIQVLDETN